MKIIRISAALVAGCLITTPVLAGDWVAVKLRGTVLELIAGEWQPLSRGDVVSDDRMIRTVGGGRVTFVKDDQTIDFGADTAGQIIDFAGEKTTIWQHFGEVSVEADVRTTEHFSVQTQYLAAVVKGTRFTVTTDDRGTLVEVHRGQVRVTDTTRDETVYVDAGEHIAVGPDLPGGYEVTVEAGDRDTTFGSISTTDVVIDLGGSDDTTSSTDDSSSSPAPENDPATDNGASGDSNDGYGVADSEPGGNGGDTEDTGDDGNNGHGNDEDGVDDSNPGNGNGKGHGKKE